MMVLKTALLLFAVCYLIPLGLSAALYRIDGTGAGWRVADRSSIGLLPPAMPNGPAVVRIFSAQTVRWRGIFATHSWIVFKPAGAARYTRYDYTAWGEPIRMNGFEPDGRWFGHTPSVVFAADGEAAAALIPRMQAAIQFYAWRNEGDYRAWPGPNSNTFVAAIMDAVPEIQATLPPTAIGKDYPMTGFGCDVPVPAPVSWRRWVGMPASHSAGSRASRSIYWAAYSDWICVGLQSSCRGSVGSAPPL